MGIIFGSAGRRVGEGFVEGGQELVGGGFVEGRLSQA